MTIDAVVQLLRDDRMRGFRIDDLRIKLNANLYGDGEIQTMTIWERLSRYISERRERIHSAWLVLTGKADIYG